MADGWPARRRPQPNRRGIAIAPTPQVEHHRWLSPDGNAGGRGLAPLDADTRARLQRLRQRAPSRGPPPSRWVLALVLLLHGIFMTVAWLEMRPHLPGASRAGNVDRVLQVRLIPRALAPPVSAPPPLPSLPTPRASPSAAPPPAPSRERVARNAMTVTMPGPAPTPRAPPRLFDRDGQPLLPATSASAAAPATGYVPRLPQGDAQVMQHADPIKYHGTRFDPYFPSRHETLLGQTVRGLLRSTHTGDSKTVSLPQGVHLKCKTLLGIPTPMCGMPPAAPSKKDGDERLSMAPAKPLANGMPTAPVPSETQCIALYRDGKPLPWGCPVDTPNRAVDAECVEQYRAGKPLASHCDAAATARAAGSPPAAAEAKSPDPGH